MRTIPWILPLIAGLAPYYVVADYSIRYVIEDIVLPPNCTEQCSTTLRVCFRDSEEETKVIEEMSNCEEITVIQASNDTLGAGQQTRSSSAFEKYYSGSFQVSINFELPDSEPLSDRELIELPAGLYNQPVVQCAHYSIGNEQTNLKLSFTVHCEEGFFGEGCERLCIPTTRGGKSCRIVYLGPIVYNGYRISAMDSVVVFAVLLMVLGVIVCIVGDHACCKHNNY